MTTSTYQKSIKPISNKAISDILLETAFLLEMKGVEYKPRMYEKAALNIGSMRRDVRDIYKEGGIAALDAKIPGVGEKIAGHIKDILTKGTFAEYKKLKEALPINTREITRVYGIGPKRAKTLWQKLRIKNLKALEEAAEAGKLRKLPKFGKRLETKILTNIKNLKS